jgi:cellulose synthase/poly-beta-1,6-N-acetylglucosamine synthase-like glycosyltransferase
MNDFSRAAALSCVSQDYPWCDVFLCDDSTDPVCREQVDRFHCEFPEKTVVLRRPIRSGFKAGNLNHALKQIGRDYHFFAVNDADGVLQRRFVSALLSAFDDERVGFVQSRQVAATSRTTFGHYLDVGIAVYWTRVVPHSAAFGFLMFHGHGALVRTAVWKRIGGFPEIVSEDLAFATEARRCGYVGVLCEGATCEEEFPSSYRAFAKRQLKYCTGTCEHLRRYMWPFLTSPEVRWYEKCDRLLASVMMMSPFLFLAAIITTTAVGFCPSRLVGDMSNGLAPSLGLRVMIWSSLAGWVCPLLPACLHMWRSPTRLVRYVVACILVHLAMAPTLAAGVLRTLVTGKTTFPVTGDRGGTVMMPDRDVNLPHTKPSIALP